MQFIKQLFVDGNEMMIIYTLNHVFVMGGLSYFEWFKMALEVAVCSFAVILIINILIYPHNIKSTLNMIKIKSKIDSTND